MVSSEQAVSQQLCGILDELRKIRILEEKKESRDVEVVYIAIPETAGTRSFSTGITKINFISGTIKNPDGSSEQIQASLGRLGKDFLHSLSLTSDQDIVLQIGSGNKKTVQSNLSLEIPYATFNEITITTTQTTNISIFASTNPFSTVNGNTVSIMKGQNAGSLVTVALDANGNILGVLKGDYGGTLKTLATDDQGRLLAKIYDPQDIFGANQSFGLSEQANRIGTPLMYDRRGQVSWFDDFEDGILKWNTSISGAGVTPVLSTSRSYIGSQSVYLDSGAGSGNYSWIYKYMLPYSTSRIGAEIKYSLAEATGDSIQIWILQYDGAHVKMGAISFNFISSTLEYWGNTGNFIPFGALQPILVDFSTWQPLKLVVDFNTGKYVRCMFGNLEYDLSGYALVALTSFQSPRTAFEIEVLGSGVSGRVAAYVDDFILTINEP